jgi:hypothetical protein
MKLRNRSALAALAYLKSLNWPHHLESVFIAFSALVFGSMLIFGLRVDSWLHELNNFLNHYHDAPASARQGVAAFLAGLYAVTLAVVVFARRQKKASAHV